VERNGDMLKCCCVSGDLTLINQRSTRSASMDRLP